MVKSRLVALLTAMFCSTVLAEPGQVDLSSAPGKVCEGCDDNIHWYQQESLKAERWADDPPKMPEPVICNEQDTSISCNGKQMTSGRELREFPGLTYVMVYIEVDNRIQNPWRFAISQIRKANNVFQRSGVPVQFLVTEIATVDNENNGMITILRDLAGRAQPISERNGADLVIALLPEIWGYWGYCGVANIGNLNPWPKASVTACYRNGSNTLAHEIGHSFGLMHDIGDSTIVQGAVGYSHPESQRGTIMSYTTPRIPFFSSPKLKYQGLTYGSHEADAVSALNDALGNVAMAHEYMMENYTLPPELDPSQSGADEYFEVTVCYEDLTNPYLHVY